MQGGKRSIESDSESYNENLVKYLSDDDYHEDRDSKSVDFDLKLVPLKASPAVVRVDCFLDDERQDCWVNCSGTVISCVKGDDDDDDDVWVATVLTCTTFTTDPDTKKVAVCWMDGLWSDGEVDAFDVYYNIALVTACVEKPVSTAVLQSLNVINSEPIPVLSRCSTLRNIHFGDTVVALGRACDERASLLASFGKFSSGHCGFDRNELLWSTCRTYQIQLGGPVINEDGEVIGVQCRSGSILPVNIISRCLGRLMINEKVNHPHLGMQVTSLHKATLRTLKDMRMKFLDTSAGVVVEEVEEGSSAYQAGIRPLDIIVQCDEIMVTSALMLFELFWDKTRGSLELVVKRASVGDTINLFIVVAEAIPDYLNRLSIDVKVSVPRNAFSSKAEKRSPFPDLVNGGLEYARKHYLDKIDESIVSVASFKGEERLFGCSGIIFDCLIHDDLHVASIISSASLLGRSFEDNHLVSDVTMVKVTLFDGKTFVADVSSFDLHYNIAILVIKSTDQLAAIDWKSSHSQHRVGEVVISLGRLLWSNKMIASPGILSNERCDLDCLELCRASCRNPKES